MQINRIGWERKRQTQSSGEFLSACLYVSITVVLIWKLWKFSVHWWITHVIGMSTLLSKSTPSCSNDLFKAWSLTGALQSPLFTNHRPPELPPPLQGNGFDSQVRLSDLHGGPLLGTISEHSVKMVCCTLYCVTKSSEGDTVMNTGRKKKWCWESLLGTDVVTIIYHYVYHYVRNKSTGSNTLTSSSRCSVQTKRASPK